MFGTITTPAVCYGRWIEEERVEALLGKGASKTEHDIRHVESAFLSFGAGPRVCPGRVSCGFVVWL